MPVPNLDAMPPDDLGKFWVKIHYKPIAAAREVFPDRPKGYVTATRNLGHYAINKQTAFNCRLNGSVLQGMDYERICDQIYTNLPAYARW